MLVYQSVKIRIRLAKLEKLSCLPCLVTSYVNSTSSGEYQKSWNALSCQSQAVLVPRLSGSWLYWQLKIKWLTSNYLRFQLEAFKSVAIWANCSQLPNLTKGLSLDYMWLNLMSINVKCIWIQPHHWFIHLELASWCKMVSQSHVSMYPFIQSPQLQGVHLEKVYWN